MKTIQSIFSPEITEALGWTFIHALWQGIVVLIGLLILLTLLHKYSSQVRYFISYTALIIMLGWSASTFTNAYSYAVEKQNLKTQLIQQNQYISRLAQDLPESEQANNTFTIDIKNVKVRAWFQRHFPIFLSIWLIGIGLFTARLLGGLAYNRKLRALQLLPFEEKWMDKLKSFTEQLNIKRKVKAYRSPHTTTPLTLGFLKPIILFPVKAFSGLSEKEIEAIIAHELAHIVRNDYFFNIVQSIIEIIFFYHPAVWIISKHIKIEREHSCDDIAINLTGDEVTYAKALTHAHIFSYQQENLSMAFARKKGSLLERIKRIQKQRVMKANTFEGLVAACIIISSIFLVSFSVGNQFSEPIYQDSGSEKASKPNSPTKDQKPKNIKLIKAKKDSILIEVEKNIAVAEKNKELSEELEQAIEIALSEANTEMAAEIIEEVNLALKEINYGEMINTAFKSAQMGIDSALIEINNDSIQAEIRAGLQEARKEIRKAMKEHKKEMKELKEVDEITELSLEAAQSGIEIASSVLESIDIESIIETSMEAANVAIKIASKEMESLNIDSLVEAEMRNVEIDKKEIEIHKQELKDHKEELKKENKELRKEMEKLRKEMEEMKAELKKQLKEVEQE